MLKIHVPKEHVNNIAGVGVGGAIPYPWRFFIPDFRKLCNGFNIFIAHIISGVSLAVIFGTSLLGLLHKIYFIIKQL